MNALRWIGFTLVAIAASSSADASVIVLQGASGAALQNAIDSAADGDTILVKSGGNFAAIAVLSKSLTIVSEPSGAAQVAHIRIDGLAANGTCSISGLAVGAGAFPQRIEITNCAGVVRLAEVTTPGNVAGTVLGAIVSNCPNVAFTRCVFSGNDSVVLTSATSSEPESALVCTAASRIALFESQLYGGHGKNAQVLPSPVWSPNPAGPGANAAEIDGSSTLFASNSTFQGGAGGNGSSAFCIGISCVPATPGNDGGIGLQALTGATATIVGMHGGGGGGGTGGGGGPCCLMNPPASGAPNGNPGQPTSGSVTTLPVGVVDGNLPTRARVNQYFPVVVQGTPGDEVFIAASTSGYWQSVPSMSGTLVAGPGLRRISIGTIPGSGVLQKNVNFPELAGLTQSLLLHVQTVTVGPLQQPQLGSGQTICMLGATF